MGDRTRLTLTENCGELTCGPADPVACGRPRVSKGRHEAFHEVGFIAITQQVSPATQQVWKYEHHPECGQTRLFGIGHSTFAPLSQAQTAHMWRAIMPSSQAPVKRLAEEKQLQPLQVCLL